MENVEIVSKIKEIMLTGYKKCQYSQKVIDIINKLVIKSKFKKALIELKNSKYHLESCTLYKQFGIIIMLVAVLGKSKERSIQLWWHDNNTLNSPRNCPIHYNCTSWYVEIFNNKVVGNNE